MMFALLLLFQASNSDYLRGIELFQKHQFEAAIPFLTQATKSQPEDARAWKALGVVYAAQGRYDLAEPSFQRACELDPKLPDACYYYARALYALNRFELSLRILERTLSDDPKSWRLHLGIAQAREALGQSQQAEKDFRNTLVFSKNSDSKPGVAYGLFLIRQGRLEESLAPLEEVLKRFPQSSEAHVYLGRALFEQGKLIEAIPHFERALAIDPASAQAHLLLAKAFVRTGRTAEAQSHFEAAARYEEGSRTVR